MEEVLDHAAVKNWRGCNMERNDLGLFDLVIYGEHGRIIAKVRNLSFLRAMSMIDEQMKEGGPA